jgi:uncharacterized protein (DUF58 family)
MRTGLAYTSARILLLIVAVWLLYLAGARGYALLALAFGVSALASYVLLSKQRDVMSAALSRRLGGAGRKAAEFRARIEEGAAAEDDSPDVAADDTAEAGLAKARDGN